MGISTVLAIDELRDQLRMRLECEDAIERRAGIRPSPQTPRRFVRVLRQLNQRRAQHGQDSFSLSVVHAVVDELIPLAER